MTVLRWFALLCLLSIPSCTKEETWGPEARIETEVDRRVDTIRTEMKVTESLWHTVRVVSFCLLAGGSLIWLFNGGGTFPSRGGHPLLPESHCHDVIHRRRVIDRPSPDDDESDDPRHRR